MAAFPRVQARRITEGGVLDGRRSSAYDSLMPIRRYGTFTGGIDLPDETHWTRDQSVAACHSLERLWAPLSPFGGEPAEPIVREGQYVSHGQRIARAAGAGGVDIFAPLAGRIAGRTTAPVAGPQGVTTSEALELVDLGDPPGIHPPEELYEWRAADPDSLRHRIAESHVTAHRRRPIALWRWIHRAREARCSILIANVMENEPYVTTQHRLLAERGPEVVRGLTLLAKALEIRSVILAVDRRWTDYYRETVAPSRLHGITDVALPHKYPGGDDVMLVKVLTRRATPPGRGPMAVGAAVTDAATCFAVYRAVACEQPPTGRIVTVSGERIDRPAMLYVPFGARCSEIARGTAPPLLHGGPMTGLPCGDRMVVGPATDAVLAIDTAEAVSPGPCIRCGWCTDHCPTRLNVALLNDAFELGQVDRAERLGVAACIGCGVCSYVCPARLPLTERMKRLRRGVKTQHLVEAGGGAHG